MKTLLLFVFALSSSQAFAANLKPDQGLYICKKGNEESICDQQLKPFYIDGSLSSITVEYVGWCGSMGPYSYACENNVCEDAGLKFEFTDSKHYRWENKQYDFHCEFEKK